MLLYRTPFLTLGSQDGTEIRSPFHCLSLCLRGRGVGKQPLCCFFLETPTIAVDDNETPVTFTRAIPCHKPEAN